MQDKLEIILNSFEDEKDKTLIKRAFEVAKKAHEPQKRESGEPYIVHPLGVALALVKIKMDASTIAAALLHDVVDDTSITLKDIENEFGNEIAFLVNGVSKLGHIKYQGVERHAENLRKMLVATAVDVRVIIIKFADRLHNMQTLSALPARKQTRIAIETLEIYAPIAMRLGVFELARQLEDLAFPYIYPKEYKYVKKESEERIRHGDKYLKKLTPILVKALKKTGVVPLSINTRVKHLYSLWRKLEKYDYNWDAINDLVAIRLIVKNIEDCYRALGIIHKLWKPLPGRIKDFIALPKPNGYQSLHTAVLATGGRKVEIQIRTKQMHSEAEFGVAAHWQYKNRVKQSQKAMKKTYDWISKLHEWKKDTSNTEDFLEKLKMDVFSDRIFVFTPTGDVIDLPQGSTPVDFAYNIHSNIGNKCAGATVNGKMVALNAELKNGDIVEVITSKNKKPSRAWLSFAKTSNAKSHIKRWFRKENEEENTQAGLSLINGELKAHYGKAWTDISENKKRELIEKFNFKTVDSILAAVGVGDISAKRVAQNINDATESAKQRKTQKHTKNHEPKINILIAGISGLNIHIAKCCNPTYPEAIAAYITIDRGASIHKTNCKELKNVQKSDKILPAYWKKEETIANIHLDIDMVNRVGMLQEVTKVIASLNVNIISINTSKKSDEITTTKTELTINDTEQLGTLIEKLKRVNGILDIKRIN